MLSFQNFTCNSKIDFVVSKSFVNLLFVAILRIKNVHLKQIVPGISNTLFMHKFCIALNFYYISSTKHTFYRYYQCGINLLVLPFSSDDVDVFCPQSQVEGRDDREALAVICS